jgi:Tol biopolymer transport system component
VFISNRTGFQEVWLARGPSWDAVQLTSFGRDNRYPFCPRWSHDGTRIAVEVERGDTVPAFANRGDETSQIVHLNVNGGASQELADGSLNVRPSWSQDDRWIYFGSRRSGTWQLWRAASDGSKNSAAPVTASGGFEALESLDGKYLFYKKTPSDDDLWMMPIEGSAPSERDAKRFRTGDVSAGWWAVGNGGIYFADISSMKQEHHAENEPKPIYFIDMVNRTLTRLGQVDRRPMFWLADFTVSRDGRLVYSQIDFRNIDLRMVRNFR